MALIGALYVLLYLFGLALLLSAEVSTLDSRSRRTYNETMINYPRNYAPLAEEEMEYTSGGLSINWMALGSTVMGLATSMLAYLNVSNIAGVAVQLQKKDPEKYPEPKGTINGNLIIDSTLTYFSSVAGIGMGLLNIAAGVGTVYLGMKSGS